jgi:hypothetical protein
MNQLFLFTRQGVLTMYTKGEIIEIGEQKNKWHHLEGEHDNSVGSDKCFVSSICPKCNAHHSVYMLWTGRGLPRKFCKDCKALISGYNEMALSEPFSFCSGKSKKRGRRTEDE